MSTPRDDLVDAAVDLLTRDGAKALSVRKLAPRQWAPRPWRSTPTSATWPRLLRGDDRRATSHLTEAVTHVPHTDDPVAEFFVVGLAYYRFAMTRSANATN